MRKRALAMVLAGALCVIAAIPAGSQADAAKKPALSKKSIKLVSGKKAVIKVKKAAIRKSPQSGKSRRNQHRSLQRKKAVQRLPARCGGRKRIPLRVK